MQAFEMHLLLANLGVSGTVVRRDGESICSCLGRMARIAPDDAGMVVQPGVYREKMRVAKVCGKDGQQICATMGNPDPV